MTMPGTSQDDGEAVDVSITITKKNVEAKKLKKALVALAVLKKLAEGGDDDDSDDTGGVKPR
jgi:inorganic pyrophosphatase